MCILTHVYYIVKYLCISCYKFQFYIDVEVNHEVILMPKLQFRKIPVFQTVVLETYEYKLNLLIGEEHTKELPN